MKMLLETRQFILRTVDENCNRDRECVNWKTEMTGNYCERRKGSKGQDPKVETISGVDK